MEKAHEVALVVGAGPGLGFSLARRFARAEMNVGMAAREPERLLGMVAECCGVAHGARAYACDAAAEHEVELLFRQVCADFGAPHLVAYNVGAFVPCSILDTSTAEFERCWRAGCLGGFLVGRAAPSCSPAPRPACADRPNSTIWRWASSACGRWPRAWRGNCSPRASTSPTW